VIILLVTILKELFNGLTMIEEILMLIGIILLGSITYLHYIMNKIQDEIKSLWLQIAVVAAATARQFTKLEEKNKDNDK